MKKTLIIAEAGVNHNGDLNQAFQLIDVAKEAGADIVKFQTFRTDNLVIKKALKAEYQIMNTNSDETQHQMLKKLELDHDAHVKLIKRCNQVGIKFLSTPFDVKSADMLHKLDMDIYKIPSGEITNYPFLVHIAKHNKTIILSTGMSTLGEIEEALNVLVSNGTEKRKITLLHCNTDYPTPFKDVNLSSMITIKHAFKLPVGYSDHTLGIEIPIAAVALGATVIEKHFTMDSNLPGPDHLASLEPSDFKQMVSAIRNIETAMGDGVKTPSESEMKNIAIARKFIVASRNLRKGEIFTEENITTKRGRFGLSPMMWKEIIGRKVAKNYLTDEIIEL